MVQDLPLQDLKLVQLKLYPDDRGHFTEWYQEARFKEWGIPSRFIQDNGSRSKPGVIRGLHYQSNPAQGKLVGVMRGTIWDVVVDLRASSKTYGQWYGVELSDTNGRLLWIPPGFAHGFCVTGTEDASVMYKVDAPYSPTSESGIRFDDPDLKIDWPKMGGGASQTMSPLLSPKDRVLPTFADYRKNPVFK